MAHEFITGLVFRGGAVEWTTLGRTKTGLEVAGTRSAGNADAAWDLSSPDVLAAVREACADVKGELCVAVPSDRALMRVVDLPTADPAELAGMAELQVDKFSPFPVEHMAISVEVLHRHETTSRVLIVAVQRDVVNAIGDAFARAKVIPHWIDVEALGWWYLLKSAGAVPEAGRRVMVILDKAGTELIVSQAGIPVVIRSLGTPKGLSEEEFILELADEIGYTLTALEAERGAAETGAIGLWQAPVDEPPKVGVDGASAATLVEQLAAKLQEAGGLGVEIHHLETLPPLAEGLARRAAEKGPGSIDLAPPEWRTREHSRKLRKGLLAASLAFAVAWLAGVSLFFGGVAWQTRRLAAVKATVEPLEAKAEEVRQLNDKIRSFEEYSDRSRSALECLREVSLLLPEDVDLNSFIYRKGATLSLRGESGAPEPIYDFFEKLEQSELFVSVKPEAVRSKQTPQGPVSEFTVVISLPGAKEEGGS